MLDVVLRSFEKPDERREFNLGSYDIVRVAGRVFGRSSFQPGWKWSRDNGPAMGLELCPLEHLGFVLSGRVAVAFSDGRVVELGAGQLFHVPAEPHDSWVIGEEPYTALHFMDADRHMSAGTLTNPEGATG